jgi:DNA-binding NtrC family response regulator
MLTQSILDFVETNEPLQLRGNVINEKVSVLLVIGQSKEQHSHMEALEVALESIGVQTQRVQSCSEARQVLERPDLRQAVFVDATLPDGAWADLARLADECSQPRRVVVVSAEPDLDLYLDVVAAGGFDCIAPPFLGADLAHILHYTAQNSSKHEDSPLPSNIGGFDEDDDLSFSHDDSPALTRIAAA